MTRGITLLREGKTYQVGMVNWLIRAGDDGLLRDTLLVATVAGNEMVSVSLHTVCAPAREMSYGTDVYG